MGQRENETGITYPGKPKMIHAQLIREGTEKHSRVAVFVIFGFAGSARFSENGRCCIATYLRYEDKAMSDCEQRSIPTIRTDE